MKQRKRPLKAWLADILEWGERLALYLEGFDEVAFSRDPKTQDAVIRCLECIGEASRQVIASGAASKFTEVEFVEAYWTPNRFIHGYYDLKVDRAWITATESAPKLVGAEAHPCRTR